MSPTRFCTECGRPIPEDAPGRICPVCLLKVGLSEGGEEVPPPPHRDRNLLFGVFAVQLGVITKDAFLEAAGGWAINPEVELPDRLVELGALTADQRQFVDRLTDEAIQHHQGDASAALDSVDGESYSSRIIEEYAEKGTQHKLSTLLGLPAFVSASEVDEVRVVDEGAGRYTTKGEQSRGGMGRILIVHDEFLDRDIALKELLPQRTSSTAQKPGSSGPVRASGALVARFLREAQVTGQLEHPSIVPVYELGRRPDGTIYYTMKLVRGRTFYDALTNAKNLDERLALLPNFVDLCHAIAYAHSRGVVHRDLKPGNVMLGTFGETVVIDWGIAKVTGQKDDYGEKLHDTIRLLSEGMITNKERVGRTATGEIIGTPAYMAPEQVDGRVEDVDARTDVFALGIMLYEILTGWHPFTGETSAQIMTAVRTGTPTPIAQIEPDAPPELVSLCEKAMQKRPEDRFQSAQELAAEIERFQTGALVRTYRYSLAETLKHYYTKHRALVNLAAAALFVLVSVGAYSYIQVVQQRNLAERAAYDSTIKLAFRYLEDRSFDAAQDALTQAPERLRRWEWYWGRRVARPWIQSLHQTRTVTWSGDGRVVATTGTDNVIRLLDASTFEELWAAETAFRRIRKPVFTPDDSQIAVIGDTAAAEIYDIDSGAMTDRLNAPLPGALTTIAFAASGQRALLRSASERCALIDPISRDVIATFGDQQFPVKTASFDTTGGFVILNAAVGEPSSAGSTSRLIESETGRTIAEFEGELIGADRAANRSYVARGGNIEVWSVPSPELIETWNVFDTTIALATVQERNSILAVSDESGTLAALNLDSGEIVFHDSAGYPLRHLRLSPDGKFLAAVPASTTGQLDAQLWHVPSGLRTNTLRGHANIANDIDFCPTSSQIASTSFDSVARIWPNAGSNTFQALTATAQKSVSDTYDRPTRVNTLSVSNEGDAVLLGFDRGVYEVVDGRTGLRTVCLTGEPSNPIDFGDIDGLGRTVIFLADRFTPGVFDLSRNEFRGVYLEHDASIVALEISTSGDRVVTVSSDGAINLWNAGSFKTIAAITDDDAEPTAAAISDSGERVCVGFNDGSLLLWTPDSGQTRRLDPYKGRVEKVAFTSGGARIVPVFADGTLGIWNPGEENGWLTVPPNSGEAGNFEVSELRQRLFFRNATGNLSVRTWPGCEPLVALGDVLKFSIAESQSESRLFLVQPGPMRDQLYRELLDGESTGAPLSRNTTPAERPVPVFSIVGAGEVEEAVRRFLGNDRLEIRIGARDPFVRLGLYGEDRLIAVNGTMVSNTEELRELLTNVIDADATETLTLTVDRGIARYQYHWESIDAIDQTQTVSVTRSQRDRMINAHLRQIQETPQELFAVQNRWYWPRGIDWESTGLASGFVVPDRFFARTAADFQALGISPRDLIDRIQGEPVREFNDFSRIYSRITSDAQGGEVTISVRRGSFRNVSITAQVVD